MTGSLLESARRGECGWILRRRLLHAEELLAGSSLGGTEGGGAVVRLGAWRDERRVALAERVPFLDGLFLLCSACTKVSRHAKQ